MRAKIQIEVIQDPQIWAMALLEFRGNSSPKVFCRIITYLQEGCILTIGKKMKSIAPIVALLVCMVFSNQR